MTMLFRSLHILHCAITVAVAVSGIVIVGSAIVSVAITITAGFCIAIAAECGVVAAAVAAASDASIATFATAIEASFNATSPHHQPRVLQPSHSGTKLPDGDPKSITLVLV